MKAQITISRVSGADEDFVKIKIRDTSSGEYITVQLSPAEFSLAITGLGFRPCELDIPSDPTRLGKTEERMKIVVELPEGISPYQDRKKYKQAAEQAIRDATPSGWEPCLYLGGKDSIRDGKAYTYASRWV